MDERITLALVLLAPVLLLWAIYEILWPWPGRRYR